MERIIFARTVCPPWTLFTVAHTILTVYLYLPKQFFGFGMVLARVLVTEPRKELHWKVQIRFGKRRDGIPHFFGCQVPPKALGVAAAAAAAAGSGAAFPSHQNWDKGWDTWKWKIPQGY